MKIPNFNRNKQLQKITDDLNKAAKLREEQNANEMVKRMLKWDNDLRGHVDKMLDEKIEEKIRKIVKEELKK
jgi:hypothetical protein